MVAMFLKILLSKSMLKTKNLLLKRKKESSRLSRKLILTRLKEPLLLPRLTKHLLKWTRKEALTQETEAKIYTKLLNKECTLMLDLLKEIFRSLKRVLRNLLSTLTLLNLLTQTLQKKPSLKYTPSGVWIKLCCAWKMHVNVKQLLRLRLKEEFLLLRKRRRPYRRFYQLKNKFRLNIKSQKLWTVFLKSNSHASLSWLLCRIDSLLPNSS